MSHKVSPFALAAAVAGALSFAAVTTATPAVAAKVKCFGIAKAGENDCANAAKTHSCAGQSKVDYDGGEWASASSKEACLKLGGKLKAFKGTNKNVKS